MNARDILSVLFTKQTAKAKSGSDHTTPNQALWMKILAFRFNLTFKIIPFGSHASRFWLMSHNLKFKLYL